MMAQVRFVTPDVGEFLTKKQTTDRELAGDWAQLEELYNKKLWHQLTLKLDSFVKTPSLQQGDNLIQLYSNFLSTFENKINPLALVEICAIITKQYTDKKEAVAFLEKIEPKVKANGEAHALCKVLEGQIYLEDLKDLENTKKIIEELENTLEDADGVTTVHGRYYQLASQYYRMEGEHALYYRAALRQLGCAGEETASSEQKAQQAFFLGLAALLAEDIYNLGELLSHPVIENLANTENSWIVDVLRAVNRGDVAAFERLKPKWSTIKDLSINAPRLKQKLSLLCLMEMAFEKLPWKRRLTFAEIAEKTRLSEEEVELLVMKALAQKLVKGAIDQVSGDVRIQWVRPRALERESVGELANAMDLWAEGVKQTAQLLNDWGKDIIAVDSIHKLL